MLNVSYKIYNFSLTKLCKTRKAKEKSEINYETKILW